MKKKITPAELEQLAKYILQLSGIVLDESKGYLLESRLGPLLETEECENYLELYKKANRDRSGKVALKIIDAISTNETSFFRDNKPFHLMAHKIFPDHFENVDPKNLRIYCAACSTGQEIYSMAITLKELLGDLLSYNVSILATDISEAALEIASMGRYSKLELSRGLSADRLRKYFRKDGTMWKVDDELRAMAVFKRLNLMQPLVGLSSYDLITCRNVAIYFSQESREMLFQRLADKLRPNGVLMIGASESLVGMKTVFERQEFHGSAYYTKVGAKTKAAPGAQFGARKAIG